MVPGTTPSLPTTGMPLAAAAMGTRLVGVMPGTVFKTQKVSGVIPRDLPTGADHLTYLAAAAAARISAPQWSKEDMFVV